jgi:hypothetical protein
MLFMPFLSERQLQELEREGLSGIDLCGNGVVVVPDGLAVFRSGGKNRFPSSALIKNSYRKNSSMVGKIFLLFAGYEAVREIRTKINQRNLLVTRWDKKPMSLSTVSKALKTLEDDLIITREGAIHLLQPDKLLEKLRENYETVYFDTRREGDFWWASPLQVYLELMAGDKRDRETAEQLKALILNNVNPVRQ